MSIYIHIIPSEEGRSPYSLKLETTPEELLQFSFIDALKQIIRISRENVHKQIFSYDNFFREFRLLKDISQLALAVKGFKT